MVQQVIVSFLLFVSVALLVWIAFLIPGRWMKMPAFVVACVFLVIAVWSVFHGMS